MGWEYLYLFPDRKQRGSLSVWWARILHFLAEARKNNNHFYQKCLWVSSIILYPRWVKHIVLFLCACHNPSLLLKRQSNNSPWKAQWYLITVWARPVWGLLGPNLLLPESHQYLKVEPVAPSKCVLLLLLCSKALPILGDGQMQSPFPWKCQRKKKNLLQTNHCLFWFFFSWTTF